MAHAEQRMAIPLQTDRVGAHPALVAPYYKDRSLSGIRIGARSRARTLPDWIGPTLGAVAFAAVAIGVAVINRPFDTSRRATECLADTKIDKYRFTVNGSDVSSYPDPGQGSGPIENLRPGHDYQGVEYIQHRGDTFPRWIVTKTDNGDTIFIPRSGVQVTPITDTTGTNCAGF